MLNGRKVSPDGCVYEAIVGTTELARVGPNGWDEISAKDFQCSPSRALNLIWGTLNWLLEGFKRRSQRQDRHKKSSLKAAHTEMQRRLEEAKHMKNPYFPFTNLQLPTILAFAVQKARGRMMPHNACRSWSVARCAKGVLVARSGVCWS